MGENINFRPSIQIQPGPYGKKFEAGLRQFRAAFSRQHGLQTLSDVVQIKHIGSRIFQLLLAQILSTPIRALLLLGQIDIQQFPAQILEAVPVGIGAHQL